ncbi:MAG TPA: sulfite:cytochrome C oxidoreductase subunit B [Epsilonproteobacteria bacterium]|nr:sulfite:cytochrome C oxidoreductase subunit B [Campylobacterota bacterium]HHD78906.1 sulfite:cytochrome C oxidoreductase subunit B [Campylobacterota bacterium]HHE06095.1 sulfite:cytochrome C oxidoreductase subunit B [Campylobacterota bacterium]
MKKIILAAALLTSALLAQTKEKIEVPYVPFPIKMGKGFDAVQANCLMCHSFGYIINQGRQSKAFWRGKVDKMIKEFKAPIDEKSAKIVTDYLFEHYGNNKEK